MTRTSVAGLALLILSVACARDVSEEDVGILEGIGDHHHTITTSNEATQKLFDQGISLAYAFNHGEAKKSFERAAALDSTCAMCWWGVALALGPNINLPMDTAANAEAYTAAQRALSLAGSATPKERAFIEAMATRYAVKAPASRGALDSAYSTAMHKVAADHPDDDDAVTLAAEAKMNLSPWNYWAADKTPHPGTAEMVASLETVMKRNPGHPGACHLYIHAVEAAYPARAVECAERLAALMPGAGHIVHMPAHIYLRVGRWNDAIEANKHAVHADETYIADQGATGFYTIAYYPHNYHFLAFAASMAGRSAEAIEAARAAAAKTPPDVAKDAIDLQLVSASPHLTLATFEKWDETLAETLPPANLRLASGLAYYARGLAHAAKNEIPQATAALDSVKTIASAITTYPGGPVMQIAHHSLLGELAAAQKKYPDAIQHLNQAMKIEDGLSYMEPPYWPRPVRQRLGAVMVDAGSHADAEKPFNEDLVRFPDNAWSLRGLERTLTAQGKTADAEGVKARIEKAGVAVR
jgi:tetratricopeptide (TPR) repeat protein